MWFFAVFRGKTGTRNLFVCPKKVSLGATGATEARRGNMGKNEKQGQQGQGGATGARRGNWDKEAAAPNCSF